MRGAIRIHAPARLSNTRFPATAGSPVNGDETEAVSPIRYRRAAAGRRRQVRIYQN